MKKGMCVTLEDNTSYILVDGVEYDGETFFVGSSTDTDDVKYFKCIVIDNGDGLEEISYDDYPEVIDALSEHVINKYMESQQSE